jgi:hypothetical protein
VVLPNTRRDQVLPDHVVFNYRRVRVRGTFLEEVLLFSLSLSLSLFVLKRRHIILGGIFGIKSMFTNTFFKR